MTVTQKEQEKEISEGVIVTVTDETTPILEESSRPTIDTIIDGDVTIGGTGIPGATLEVILPDGSTSTTEADPNGR